MDFQPSCIFDKSLLWKNAEILDFKYFQQSMHQPVIKIEPNSPSSSRVGTPVAPTQNGLGQSMNLEIHAVYSEKNSGSNVPVTTSSNINSNSNNNRRDEIVNMQEPPPLAPIYKTRRHHESLFQQEPDQSDFDRFGAYVASKLKRSSKKQMIIAEKVIAEVLMRANLGTLEETTMLTDFKQSRSSLL